MGRQDGGTRQGIGAALAVLWALTALVAAWPAAAQEAGPQARAVRMPEMTVSARGYGAKASQTPGGVGVVTAREIEETAPVSVTDAMERIPGVSTSTDSPWGGEIVIRGMSRDSVVFLIDGCRVNVTTDINGRFGLINPEDVERIEVLKGPVSALYGSGSTGGVVNIITKRASSSTTPRGAANWPWAAPPTPAGRTPTATSPMAGRAPGSSPRAAGATTATRSTATAARSATASSRTVSARRPRPTSGARGP